jgi:hypothetical protein
MLARRYIVGEEKISLCFYYPVQQQGRRIPRVSSGDTKQDSF